MTIKNLQELGIFKLMPNGFNVYNYEDGSPIINLETDIPDNWEEIKNTWKIEAISGDPEEFITAIYVSKP